MALTFGSLRHDYSGRKRKPLKAKTGCYVPKFKELPADDTYRRETKQYRSVSDVFSDCSAVDRSALIKESRHTIAPAYNKGAYQVISAENIKDIGR